MNWKERAEGAEALLRELVRIRAYHEKRGEKPYDELRRVRRTEAAMWDKAKAHVTLIERLPTEDAPPAAPTEDKRNVSRKQAAS